MPFSHKKTDTTQESSEEDLEGMLMLPSPKGERNLGGHQSRVRRRRGLRSLLRSRAPLLSLRRGVRRGLRALAGVRAAVARQASPLLPPTSFDGDEA